MNSEKKEMENLGKEVVIMQGVVDMIIQETIDKLGLIRPWFEQLADGKQKWIYFNKDLPSIKGVGDCKISCYSNFISNLRQGITDEIVTYLKKNIPLEGGKGKEVIKNG